MARVQDEGLRRVLHRAKTAVIVPAHVLEGLQSAYEQCCEEMRGQGNYMKFLKTNPSLSNILYRMETCRGKLTELTTQHNRLRLAVKEADLISGFLENPEREREDRLQAQQRLTELGELAGPKAVAGEGKEKEETPREARPFSSTQTVALDLGLVTRLAGSGLRAGPMQFRLIAGQLERTYMNIVRITTDKEDTKKFVRTVRKFFLPPGKNVGHVGITERWLAARGFDAKEIRELIG